jgi:hypothetical protein
VRRLSNESRFGFLVTTEIRVVQSWGGFGGYSNAGRHGKGERVCLYVDMCEKRGMQAFGSDDTAIMWVDMIRQDRGKEAIGTVRRRR